MKPYKHKCINDNIVIIDGLTRSGKFYLGKLLSSIRDLEYFINSSEIERIIIAGLTGITTKEDASALMALATNEEIYNRAIGRNMNLRPDDSSSILNSYEKENYYFRQENKTGWGAVKNILDSNRYSVFVLHQSLQALEIIKGAIPRPFIINLRRHPFELAFSWIHRGWGRRYGSDPLAFEPVFQHAESIIPYFAVDWGDEYLKGNEYDRVVKSIVYLTEKESNAIDGSEGEICHVYYDHLVINPKKEIEKICIYLNKEPHESISEVLKRETQDTNLISDREKKENQIYSNIKDKDSFDKLMALSKAYERFISI
jgi:hypothetical protein